MRPELPQGFHDDQVFRLFDSVAQAHFELIGHDGKLPQDPRGHALRALGQLLMVKLTGRRDSKLAGGRPIVAPFANAVGRAKYYRESVASNVVIPSGDGWDASGIPD